MTTVSNNHGRRIAAFAILSWLGAFIHNMADLPGLTLLSPENSIPALITLVLFLAWWQLPNKRLPTLVLLAWAFFPQFLGGSILSVIPFSFWPWNPPQTLFHYAMHVVYATAQLPLIIALVRQLRANDHAQHLMGEST
jgi:hypothetical protein